MIRKLTYILVTILLAGCSPVPIHVLQKPPLNEVAPVGYIKVASHEFNSPQTLPNDSINTSACWGIDGVMRVDGGMWDKEGHLVPPDDPKNYCEYNPQQVQWGAWGGVALVTDTNTKGKPDFVGGFIATKTNYMPPVYVAARIKVAPDGGRYWTSLVSYSPNGWQPENDIAEFESYDSKQYTASLHRLAPDGSDDMIATAKFKYPVDLSDDFHIYSADIQVNKIIIYLDNVKIWEYESPGLNDELIYFTIGSGIFKQANKRLIKQEILEQMVPRAAYVDWMRIYKP